MDGTAGTFRYGPKRARSSVAGMDARRLAEVGRALASESRAGIVVALMDGTAHTGQELARHLGVAASTTSEHLGVLIDAGLVTVAAQGRHRYFRLANAEVAALLESTLVAGDGVAPPKVPAGLAYARSCYDHLAGRLGVEVYARLVELDAVVTTPGGLALTPVGADLLGRLGVDTTVDPSPHRRAPLRACLDWSQRRHHLAGTLGARLLTALLDTGCLVRRPTNRRELRLTHTGHTIFRTHLGVEASSA
jgi:DNA-binding transcriptional ArsR family regulator